MRSSWRSLTSRIWIARDGSAFHAQWVQGTSWVPDTDLRSGEYCWWVRGWGPDSGMSEWISCGCFRIGSCLADAIGGLSPDHACLNDQVVNYQWVADPCATWYQLWAARNGEVGINEWFAAGSAAATITRPWGGHPFGEYQWWVRGWGPDGMGPWSSGARFTVGKAQPVGPI